MIVGTHWARDEEYHLPFYRYIARRTTQIYELTGRHKLDPEDTNYADGIYWSRQWEYPWAVEQAEPTRGMTVLDVGCGLSPLLIYLGQIGCKAYGSDPGYEGRDGLWGQAEDFGAPHVVEIRKEPMAKLSWENNYFDRVFCISVLEHIEVSKEIEQGIAEMYRVLKPNGKLIITMDELGVTIRRALLAIGVFTAGNKFTGYFDREYPSTRYPYNILGMVLEK